MITIDELKQSLSARQITLPQHELDMILATVNSVSDCLASNYDESTARQISLFASLINAINVAGL